MARSAWALALLSLPASACAPEPELFPSSVSGGTIARGYGVSIKGISYVPDDRIQSFGVVEACERGDRPTCSDRAWSTGELGALARAAQQVGELSGFETSFVTDDPEVRVHARREAAAAPACSDGTTTCWFGSTDCSEAAGVLVDERGTPLIDARAAASRSFTRCARWSLELSLANIYAWADFLGLDRWQVLRSVALHEMGHTLGLAHHRLGIMRAHLPVCYFIEPGDPRDLFDPGAGPAPFQRFECREGVTEPALAPAQRAKLDAFQSTGGSWSLVRGDAPRGSPAALPLR